MDSTIVVAALGTAGTAVTGFFGWLAARAAGRAVAAKTAAEEETAAKEEQRATAEASRQRIASMYEDLDRQRLQQHEREQRYTQQLSDQLDRERELAEHERHRAAQERSRADRLQSELDECRGRHP